MSTASEIRDELDAEIPVRLLKRLRESANTNSCAYVPPLEAREAINLIAASEIGSERDRRWRRMVREELGRFAAATPTPDLNP